MGSHQTAPRNDFGQLTHSQGQKIGAGSKFVKFEKRTFGIANLLQMHG